MVIEGRKIGKKERPLVIAEIGINHAGSIKIAKEMVDAAHLHGAEVIKHQTHIVEDEMSSVAKTVIPSHTTDSIYDIMNSCALSEKEELELKKYIEQKGMIFISTPFSRAAADRLEKMNVSAYKIGSGECNNYPLIEHVAKFGKPMIVSTGMNNIKSIRKTVDILEKYNIDYALLHCTNVYPTPARLVRLGGISQLEKEFPNAVVGLSDHTINNNACLAASALGACILERHFTDTKDREGPDIICSMDSRELQELRLGVEEIFQMRGGSKGAVEEEKPTIDFAFATVVAINDISIGEKFTMDNIWVKRPGTGKIKAEEFNNILGKYSTKDIEVDTHLDWECIK